MFGVGVALVLRSLLNLIPMIRERRKNRKKDDE